MQLYQQNWGTDQGEIRTDEAGKMPRICRPDWGSEIKMGKKEEEEVK